MRRCALVTGLSPEVASQLRWPSPAEPPAWRTGAAHADMSADKFIARLCALVPPPGFHMLRYFGVLANRHHLRPRIIPPSAVPAPGNPPIVELGFDGSNKPAFSGEIALGVLKWGRG